MPRDLLCRDSDEGAGPFTVARLEGQRVVDGCLLLAISSLVEHLLLLDLDTLPRDGSTWIVVKESSKEAWKWAFDEAELAISITVFLA